MSDVQATRPRVRISLPRPLPSFLIIGANKAGTTSIYRYLAAHPNIFFPQVKEIRFFTHYYERGIRWYSSHFADSGNRKERGEASPLCFSTPGVAQRVAAMLPDARLIVSLRHPVDRIYSTYWDHVARGRQRESFDTLIADELSVGRGFYLDQSTYADHFGEWDERYDRYLLHVLFLDDLIANPKETYHSLCRFLEVEEIVPSILGKNVNEYRRIRSVTIRKLAKRLPRPAERIVSRLNTAGGKYPAMSVKTRAALMQFFRPQNDRLRDRLERPVPPSWNS